MNVSFQERMRTATSRSRHGERVQKQHGDIKLVNTLSKIYLDITSFVIHYLWYSSNIHNSRLLLSDCFHVQTTVWKWWLQAFISSKLASFPFLPCTDKSRELFVKNDGTKNTFLLKSVPKQHIKINTTSYLPWLRKLESVNAWTCFAALGWYYTCAEVHVYIVGHGWVNSLLFQRTVSPKQHIKIKISNVA
jgi:hypothetical protein